MNTRKGAKEKKGKEEKCVFALKKTTQKSHAFSLPVCIVPTFIML